MTRTKSPKAEPEPKKADLEELQITIKQNQDQLQDLTAQLNSIELRLDNLLTELDDSPRAILQQDSSSATLSLSNHTHDFDRSGEVVKIAKSNGIYTFRFKSFNFFRWVGVLTVGAVIGIFMMGIFG